MSVWQSERYGAKQAISTLEIRCVALLPHDFVTILDLSPETDPSDAAAGTRTLRRRLDALTGMMPADLGEVLSMPGTTFDRDE